MNLRAASAPQKNTPGYRPKETITIREPRAEDGAEVWRLISQSGSLDENSRYCNLLQCSHFSGTCALAQADGETVGWASGYIPPGEPDTLFIWQVCVAERARGHGLGKRLLMELLQRLAGRGVRYMTCTITDTNDASWALFGGVADNVAAPVRRQEWFTRETHFDGRHDTEHLMSIGPIDPKVLQSIDTARRTPTAA